MKTLFIIFSTFFLVILIFKLVVSCMPRYVLDVLGRRTGILFRFNTDKKLVALTIDDGPSPHTLEILDFLDQQNPPVKATFFLIGQQVERYPDITREIIRRGHEIANHDFYNRISAWSDENSLKIGMNNTHQLLLDSLQSAMQTESVEEVYQVIRQSNNHGIKWFRPGVGFVTKKILCLARKMGYQVVLGDAYFHDPSFPFSSIQSWYFKRRVQPGSIIILHDGSKSRVQVTLETLRRIVPYFQKELGYKLCTLNECTVK